MNGADKLQVGGDGAHASDEALMLEFQRGSLFEIPNPGFSPVRDRYCHQGLKGNNLKLGRDPSPRLEVGGPGFQNGTDHAQR